MFNMLRYLNALNLKNYGKRLANKIFILIIGF